MNKLPYSLLLLTALLTACEDREIKIYHIAREAEPPASLPSSASNAGKPDWVAPSTWKELPPSGMRAATFAAENSQVDVSVVTFPGTAGGLISNLNRWRGQLGLPAQTDEANIETLSANGQPVQIVELTSPTENKAMLGAMFLRDDQSWFIKLTGDKTAVAAQKENFRAFASSLNFRKGDAKKSTNDG